MAVLETIGLNLAATGLAAGGPRGVKKVREILREKRFSDEIEELETEFNTLLRDEFIKGLGETDSLTTEEVERNWANIATELDEIGVVFETEEEAITQITTAMVVGLGYNLESDPQLHEEVSGVVAGIYRDVLRTFEEEIADTELADRLDQRANIELTSTVNEVASRLEEIERRQRRQRDADLRGQGFVSLSPLYFERQVPEPPARCWRTGFELVEVDAGYAVERETEREDGTRYRLADALYDRLRNGSDAVVLGPPGSGKSTICKQVACQWYDEGDTVFYRTSDHARPLSDWHTVVDRLRETSGRVLVVVEDAIRDEAVDIFRVTETFRNDPDVTFLLDSREGEWHGSDTKLTDARLQEIKDNGLEHVTVPRIDERECERIIEHFESTTGVSIADPPTRLFEQVNTSSGVGELLQLSYHLSFYAAGTEGASPHSEGITSLEKSVQTLINRQRSEEDERALELGVLVNLLNATDTGVHPELLHALAPSEADHREIDALLEQYEGTLVFAQQDERVTDQIEPLRTNHEFWSTLYLQEFLDILGEREATRVFESCLDKLFTVLDDAERRAHINRWFREEMPFFAEFEAAPTETADMYVERLFDLGRRQPALAPLYGSTKFTILDPPSVCSPDIPVRMALWRGIMYYHGGNLEAAEDEFEAAQDLLDEQANISTRTAHEIGGWCLNYRGAIERSRGDLDSARERHRRSQTKFREIDDTLGVAFTLYNIGKLYRVKSDLDAAQQYLEGALDLFRDTGERRYVSNTLNNLGLVLRDQGKFSEAEQRLRQSRQNAREAGDERSEGRSLNHLGEVKKYQSEFEAADDHYRRALKLARKVGDKQCRAWLVHNIGDLAYKRGNLEQALEYFSQSKKLGEEIGNQRGVAITLNYLAELNSAMGEYEVAHDHVSEGLELVRGVGDRRREAELLKTRGIIAKNRGEFARARESLNESLGIFEEIGDRKWEADALLELGTVALKTQSFARAEELFNDGLGIKRDIRDREGEVRALGGLGKLAKCRGQLDEALERCRESRDIATEIGDKEGKAYSLRLLGEIARERNNLHQSWDHLSTSRSLFEEIGDRRRLAELDRQDGLTALEADDLTAARESLDAAQQRFADLGDQMGVARSVADRGRVAYADGNFDEAASHLRTAIERFRTIGVPELALECVEELFDVQAPPQGGEFHTIARELRQEVAGEGRGDK
jgi:tetratricopeptide (TPR) repeat protein